MITKESIEERKETIVSDIETVKGRLIEYDQKKLEDTIQNTFSADLHFEKLFSKMFRSRKQNDVGV